MKREKLNPTDILKSFIDSMFKWNVKCQELDKTPGEFYKHRERVLSDLNEIFSCYLTLKERKQGRQASLSFSNPPEYNLATNKIVSCKEDPKKAYIEVQETVGFKELLRYTLLKKNDGWRIDKKEAYNKFDNKWEKRIL